ncbi:MAG: hypothetical protein P8163_14835 [Candidatus Thiodiazotropha sp.]
MESSDTTYNVVFSGKLLQGFETEQAVKAFSTLFKLPQEKTVKILGKRHTLKKGVSRDVAKRWKKKLQEIGLEVSLEPQAPAIASEPGLSLVPIEEESDIPVTTHVVETATPSKVCPNCGSEVATMTDPCPNCGVYPHKVISRPKPHANRASNSRDVEEFETTSMDADDSNNSLTMQGLIAGAAAALIGALLWKGITVAIDYELGFIAWIIGGGIGFAVAFSGNRGQAAAVFCGVMALVAILGGKYLFFSGLQNQVGEIIADSSADLHLLYAEEMSDAKALAAVNGEADTRQFMVDHGYSEASSADSVTREELDQFQNEITPRLVGFSDLPPSYDEWYQSTIEENFESISPIDILIESFDFFDAIFLFLGISTAARIGYGKGYD